MDPSEKRTEWFLRGEALVAEGRGLASKGLAHQACTKYSMGIQFLMDVMPDSSEEHQWGSLLREHIAEYLGELEHLKLTATVEDAKVLEVDDSDEETRTLQAQVARERSRLKTLRQQEEQLQNDLEDLYAAAQAGSELAQVEEPDAGHHDALTEKLLAVTMKMQRLERALGRNTSDASGSFNSRLQEVFATCQKLRSDLEEKAAQNELKQRSAKLGRVSSNSKRSEELHAEETISDVVHTSMLDDVDSEENVDDEDLGRHLKDAFGTTGALSERSNSCPRSSRSCSGHRSRRVSRSRSIEGSEELVGRISNDGEKPSNFVDLSDEPATEAVDLDPADPSQEEVTAQMCTSIVERLATADESVIKPAIAKVLQQILPAAAKNPTAISSSAKALISAISRKLDNACLAKINTEPAEAREVLAGATAKAFPPVQLPLCQVPSKQRRLEERGDQVPPGSAGVCPEALLHARPKDPSFGLLRPVRQWQQPYLSHAAKVPPMSKAASFGNCVSRPWHTSQSKEEQQPPVLSKAHALQLQRSLVVQTPLPAPVQAPPRPQGQTGPNEDPRNSSGSAPGASGLTGLLWAYAEPHGSQDQKLTASEQTELNLEDYERRVLLTQLLEKKTRLRHQEKEQQQAQEGHLDRVQQSLRQGMQQQPSKEQRHIQQNLTQHQCVQAPPPPQQRLPQQQLLQHEQQIQQFPSPQQVQAQRVVQFPLQHPGRPPLNSQPLQFLPQHAVPPQPPAAPFQPHRMSPPQPEPRPSHDMAQALEALLTFQHGCGQKS